MPPPPPPPPPPPCCCLLPRPPQTSPLLHPTTRRVARRISRLVRERELIQQCYHWCYRIPCGQFPTTSDQECVPSKKQRMAVPNVQLQPLPLFEIASFHQAAGRKPHPDTTVPLSQPFSLPLAPFINPPPLTFSPARVRHWRARGARCRRVCYFSLLTQ